ncbi:MAG: hypothetical protein AAFY28_00455 [Actinomycetota bacterium]
MNADDDLDGLIHRADLDGLVRLIDDRTATCDWEGLDRVRRRARAAVATGRQLWPAATLAEYRLVLLATPEFVATVLDDPDSGRFAIGPLPEVAAQHHSWADLAPLLDPGPVAAFTAHERVLRGDAVDSAALPDVLDIPTEVASWEPPYALAEYRDNDVRCDRPGLPTPTEELVTTIDAERLDDDVDLAVRQLVEVWTAESNGTIDTACVEGNAAAAIGALGVRRARMVRLTPQHAMTWLAWCGASGGAHGRRRGAATGRFGAWWVLAALGDILDRWPIASDELGAVAAALRWYRWDAFEPDLGWTLRLAVEDQTDGVAWAINAADAA